MLIAALIAAPLCFFTLAILVPLLRRYGVLDRPCYRSSHFVPTPRGGGAAVVLAFCLSSLVVDRSRVTVTVIIGVLVASLVGLVEDIRGVPVLRRLVVQSLVGIGLVSIVIFQMHGPWALIGSTVLVLFVVAIINAVNFMDGINGISAATGVVAGLAYAGMGNLMENKPLAVLGASISVACAVFAPWNVPRARVFLGDVGSYGLGAGYSGCLVIAGASGAPPEAAVGPLALYLADTGSVLVQRHLRHEPIGEPHRCHVYQRLTDTGMSHGAVSLVVLAVTALVSALGLIGFTGITWLRISADVLALAILLAYLAAPSQRGRELGA